MVRNTGAVNEYEARSAIIPFVGKIIRKEYELRQQCHFILLIGVLRHWKKSDFSWAQYVLLIVRSQYRYKAISKIRVFRPSRVHSKIYILSCFHISLKINMSLILTRARSEDRQPFPGGGGGGTTVWEPVPYTVWATPAPSFYNDVLNIFRSHVHHKWIFVIFISKHTDETFWRKYL
jgi:hypothetical protein